MKNFRTLTVHALSWSLSAKVFSQVLSIVFGIVLARLLMPEDFGLIAMVVVVVGFAGLLSDVGLGAALIQRQGITEDHYSSIFWVNNALGLILVICLILLSPAIADFYGRPEIETIVIVLSFNFLFAALTMVPRARLNKSLAFRELSIIDVLSMLAGAGTAITLAVLDFGYWSLVVQQLVNRSMSTVLIWAISRWKPKLICDFVLVRELFGFSINVFFTQVLQFIAGNISNVLIGKYLSAHAVGLFDKAQSMMLFPLHNVSHVVGSVMFPSLSKIQGDLFRVRETYLRLISSIALITFPMMVGMFVVSEYFVIGVLGPHWHEVVPLFKILCVVGIFTSIVTVTGSVYLSQGRADLQLKVNLIIQPLRIIAIVAGLPWGVLGVVIGFAIGHVVAGVITLSVATRLIELDLIKIFSKLLPMFLMSVVMGVVIFIIGQRLIFDSSLVSFLVQVFCGTCVYILIVFAVKPAAYLDIKAVLEAEFLSKVKINKLALLKFK